jgi:PKHD-type hydroxylase
MIFNYKSKIMSAGFIHIPSLLNKEQLGTIDEMLTKVEFIDGRATASMGARSVKNNLQVKANDATLPQLQQVINDALYNNLLFNAAVFPKHIYPILFSKYEPGMQYGWHVDSPVMGNPPIRTDLAMTIFLSAPADYDGGELMIQTPNGNVHLKPERGDAVVYPCAYLHCVNSISRGTRLAAVSWIQSSIRLAEQRQILLQLNQVHGAVANKDMNSPEANLLLQTYSNLLRMWTEI